jgi:predicted PurR-regulated permease PerM
VIAKDKQQHLLMGAACTAVLWAIHFLPVWAAVAIGGVLFGVFYEVQQWYRKEGKPEFWDATATALPGVIVGALLYTK